jgi:integrase
VPTLLFLSLFSRRVFFDRVRILADHSGVVRQCNADAREPLPARLGASRLIGAGTTLHGLRISYAAWWKRTGGANNSEVADLLGDKSERMGKHDTRHVEAEANVIRAFNRVRDAK